MSYVQLTSEERYVIYHLKLFKLGLQTTGSGLSLSYYNRDNRDTVACTEAGE